MAYELLVAEKDELRFCFHLSGEGPERCGAIGYLRADFGRNGNEFHTTWFDSQPHLKTPDFKCKFDELIHFLREGGPRPPFASRDNYLAFCAAHPSMTCFKISTRDYSIYIRLNPHKGTYDIYCFAYDNRYLLPERAGQHELPEHCYSVLPSTGDLILIRRNGPGYYPCNYSADNPETNRKNAAYKNTELGVTRAQEKAMLAGSLFGWDAPAAKPWHYDQNGNLRPAHHPKKNEPIR
jgi:hypothetical protein